MPTCSPNIKAFTSSTSSSVTSSAATIIRLFLCSKIPSFSSKSTCKTNNPRLIDTRSFNSKPTCKTISGLATPRTLHPLDPS